MVRPSSDHYAFDFAAADDACKGLGGRLITLDEMVAAYNAGWLHMGWCAYISTGNAYYVLQYTVHGTGWGGMQWCNWDTYWDAFCYLPGPEDE